MLQNAFIKRKVRLFLGKHYPKLLVTILYRIAYGKWLDWKHPKTLNEKINWLKFNSDTSLWTILADKYRVRDYVKSKGCGELLVKLHGIWKSPDEIDWDALPNQFVLKTNNGCGDVRICRDKGIIDREEWLNHFRKVLKEKIGYERGEPHYNKITPPAIMAEELLDCSKQPIKSSSLIDYKVWCFNGCPYCVFVLLNRMKKNVEIALYDTDWNPINEKLKYSSHYRPTSQNIPRPKSLHRMLQYSSILSFDLPQSRIDFYEVDGKPYFGEITMTSAGGFMDYFTEDYLNELGDLVKL